MFYILHSVVSLRNRRSFALFPRKERNCSLLHKKFSRTNYVKHTVADKGIEVWSNLSDQHKKIKVLQFLQKDYQKLFPTLLQLKLIYIMTRTFL